MREADGAGTNEIRLQCRSGPASPPGFHPRTGRIRAFALPWLAAFARPLVRKRTVALLGFAALLAVSLQAHAQPVYVSSTGQSGTVGQTVSKAFYQAQKFTTGSQSGGYELGGVGLIPQLNQAVVTDVFVRIYSADADGLPDSVVYTLINPGSFAGGAEERFTAPSGAMLSADTSYFVAVEVASGSSVSLGMVSTTSNAEDSGGSGGWSIFDKRHFWARSTGNWAESSTNNKLKIAVYGVATPPTVVPENWSLKPSGLSAGDQFRLLFLSSTKRDGSATDIATYNTFVQTRAAAGHTDIQAYSDGFTAVGCTGDVDARDNTGTTGTGVPIHWLNGNKVADDYADFYDEDWDDEANDKNELGANGPNTNNSGNYPLTGCKHDGTEAFNLSGTTSYALGVASGDPVRVGRPNSSTSGHGPISSNNITDKTNNRPMYGLSAVFEVGVSTTPTVLVSNTGQTSEDFDTDAIDYAQQFTTGSYTDGYTLSSIDIGYNDADNTAFSASIWKTSPGGIPTEVLYALTPPGTFSAGNLTFTAPANATLDAGTRYVVTLALRSAGGATVERTATANGNEDSGAAAGWSIANSYHFSSSPGNWGVSNTNKPILIAVKGTLGVTTTVSTDATLSALVVNDGTNDLTLDPTFASGTYAYDADVGNATTTVTLTATVNDAGASVTGVTLGGTAIADTDFTDGITVPSLVEGDNAIVVTVTAEDATTQDYTVTVSRARRTTTTPTLPAEVEVANDWSLIPSGLVAGDKFRLLFLSSTKTDGRSYDIADYNTFVQGRAAAGHTDIRAYSGGFRAVGCTPDSDARDNTGTTGTGVVIHWLNGVKVADDNADFYNENWDNEANDKNELGNNGPNTSQSVNYPLTGCRHIGTEAFSGSTSEALGAPGGSVRVGRPNSSGSGHGPIGSNQTTADTSTRPMYGLSQVFEVAAAVVTNTDPVFMDGASTSRDFDETIGNAAVATASNIGTAVAATDADTDTLTYSIAGTDAGKFGLIATNGRIRTKVGEKYDHEADSSYSVTLSVTDGNGGSDSIAVTLNVEDQAEPPVAPNAPTVTATSGSSTSLDVDWTAPANTGRPTISNYDLQYQKTTESAWTNGPQDQSGDASGGSATIGSLDAGTAYRVQVRATNPEGDGPWSGSGSGTTATAATPGVTVSESSLTVAEEDTTGDSYTVVLDSQPTANVVVTVAGHSGTDVTLDTTTMTFTTVNWSTAQEVTVTAADDANTAGETVTLTHSAASTDSDYGGIAIAGVTVTVEDNDTAQVTGVTVDSGNAQLVVGWDAVGNATGYRVQWKSGGQSYNTSRQAIIASGSTTSHTISSLANGTEYTMRVKAARTGASDGPWSDDATGTPEVPAAPGVTLSKTALTVTEEDATGDSYTVVLDTLPTVNVVVTVAGHLGTGVTLDTTTLTFTTVNWETAQTVTVTAGNDADTAGETVTLTHSAASTDSDYGGIAIADVTVTVEDNDTAQVTGVTVESGNAQLVVGWNAVGNATGYRVQWKSGGQGYNTSRQATIASGSTTSHTIPSLANGTEYTLRVRAVRTGANEGPWSDDATGTPEVPTVPGVTLSKTALTVIEEDATGDSYTVVLDTLPTASVTVTVAGHSGTGVTPTPATRTFTTVNWSTAQAVTVTAADDADTADETVTLTHSAASTDSDYDGIAIAIADVTVTVEDDDGGAATGKPTISGPAQIGMTLTAETDDIMDADGLTSVSYTYQWLRAGADIAGETNSTYAPLAADWGEKLRVRVTFTDDESNPESLSSDETLPVAPAAATCPTDDATVWCATLTVGHHLEEALPGDFYVESAGFEARSGRDPYGSVAPATFSHLGVDYTVSSLIGSGNDDAAFATTPDLPVDGAGLTLHVQTYGGEIDVALSGTFVEAPGVWYLENMSLTNPTDALSVVPLIRGQQVRYGRVLEPTDLDTEVTVRLSYANRPAAGAPTIGGTAQAGATLTADPSGITDADGLTGASYTYRWIRVDGGTETPITGATSSTYVPVAADVGKKVKVEATFTDDGGNIETPESDPYPSGGTIVAAVVGSVSVRFGSSTYTAPEGGSVTVTVQLSDTPASPVTIPLTRTNLGGATNADYSGFPTAGLTFGTSDTSKTFTLTVVDDSADDDGESVRIGFGPLPAAVTTGSPSTATVVLADNDGEDPVIAVRGDLRLVGGPADNEGRLEVFLSNEWGTVCDDHFEDANNLAPAVACRILGWEGGQAKFNYGQSGVSLTDQPIWLDDVRCLAREPSHRTDAPVSLLACFNVGVGTHNCGHDEDVGVICTGARGDPNPHRGPVLVRATVDGDGRVVLAFDKALDADALPAMTAFAVTVDNASTAVAVLGSPGTGGVGTDELRLEFSPAIAAGTTVRVSYTDPTSGDDAAAIQDAAGNDAQSFMKTAVQVREIDTVAPALTGDPTVNGVLLTLAYDEPLNAGSVPDASAYTVTVDGSTRPVTGVTMSADTVTLTLSPAVTAGQTVTLSYTPSTDPVRDEAENEAAALTSRSVTNLTGGTATVPALTGDPTVNGAMLTLTYDEPLDARSVPDASAYAVTVAGSTRSVTGVSVSASTVTLTLSSAVTAGQTVTLSYTPSTNPVRDEAENEAAALTDWSVTNNTDDGIGTGTGTGTGTGGGTGGGGGSANRPPVIESAIEDQTLVVGESLELDIRLNFYDRDQRALDYTVESVDPSVAEVEVDRNGVVTIHGLKRGVTAITVTAADRRDERVSQTVVVTVGGPALVALVPRAADLVREGFVRVINHSGGSGEIAIEAIDDAGTAAGPVVLTLDANETAHFNSKDLEDGNADKGLSGGVGPGEGDWRLVLDSDLDFEVLSYIRTEDGFLTAMHDTVPLLDGTYRVAIFNPGSNPDQVSHLRLINPGGGTAEVTVEGIDDAGDSPGDAVTVDVPAGESVTLTASELELGAGLDAALGDGFGKWRLRVMTTKPIVAMSLLSSPTGHLTNLSALAPAPGEDGAYVVPLFPAASDALGRQGFVRVVNRAGESGMVSIEAYDDSDLSYPPVTLALNARQTQHFNSDDLELGNADKGLTGSTGVGMGDWRLVLSSDLDIDVLAYIRTEDGFLTSMHDVAPMLLGERRVAIFNPGSNPDQVSRLRLVNPGADDAEVTITGIDDAGASPGGTLTVTVPAGASRTIEAADLEAGAEGFGGALGDGAGKWRLTVTSEQPVIVMSLLSSPTGHLTNLSTAPDRGGL